MIKNRLIAVLLTTTLLSVGCSKEALTPEKDITPESSKNDTNDSSFEPSILNDSLALVALYKAFDGANWSYSNWTKTPLRYWEGVSLGDIDGQSRVVSVELHGDFIKGQIPSQIKMLTELQRLFITSSRYLTGSIIDEVFELRKLRVLNFEFTELTGELSPKIGQLTELDTLVLWKSQFAADNLDKGESSDVNWSRNTVFFSGSIPAEIGKLTKLRHMNFARAGFENAIPEEIGNLESVTRLDLSENRLTGAIPSSIGKLKKLDWLALCFNNLSGTIPEEVCNATALKTFIVSNNKLSGEIPAEIGNLPNLNYLAVENNLLTGSLPSSLENCRKLGLVYASNNQLSGSVPSELGRRHPWLIAVYLENNNLTGSLPNIVGNEVTTGTWCCSFYVAGNKLSGTVPEMFMRFPESARKSLIPQQSGFGFDNLK